MHAIYIISTSVITCLSLPTESTVARIQPMEAGIVGFREVQIPGTVAPRRETKMRDMVGASPAL